MESGAWSVECGVWSVECGAWNVECGAWSVERGVWGVERGDIGWWRTLMMTYLSTGYKGCWLNGWEDTLHQDQVRKVCEVWGGAGG